MHFSFNRTFTYYCYDSSFKFLLIFTPKSTHFSIFLISELDMKQFTVTLDWIQNSITCYSPWEKQMKFLKINLQPSYQSGIALAGYTALIWWLKVSVSERLIERRLYIANSVSFFSEANLQIIIYLLHRSSYST